MVYKYIHSKFHNFKVKTKIFNQNTTCTNLPPALLPRLLDDAKIKKT